ncbi:MAG: molybdenum cofactor biosynthesis protein MoaE [Nitriliruptoraceae bacterium]
MATPVTIQVRLFGGLAELAGSRSVAIELVEPATVADLVEAIASTFPALRDSLDRCKVAVDLEVAASTTTVGPDNEVALLPPVAGGSQANSTPPPTDVSAIPPPSTVTRTIDDRSVVVTSGLMPPPLSVDKLIATITGPSVGAAVSFLGTVRDHAPDLDGVVGLEYSAYPAMAERELMTIADDIAQQHSAITGIALVHAVGDLAVGDHTILVACVSPHRAQAFDACRDALEEVKRRAPIWKRERTRDGMSRWVGL